MILSQDEALDAADDVRHGYPSELHRLLESHADLHALLVRLADRIADAHDILARLAEKKPPRDRGVE